VATTTERLMREGLPTMRDMIVELTEIEDGSEIEMGTHPLEDYAGSLGALADAVQRGDEPSILRFEAALLADPALRARPERDTIPTLDDDTSYVEGLAGVLYLFRDETHALTDAGQIVHLGAFTPAANERDFAAQGEEAIYVEVGDWIEVGDDGAHGPVRAGDAYWAMVDWADDEDDGVDI